MRLYQDRKIKGYKLDALGAPGRSGPDVRVRCPVYREMLLESPVRLNRLRRPWLEPAIALVLAGDVLPGATPDAARLAVGGLFLAISVLDGARGGQAPDAAVTAAGNAHGGDGFVLGERLLCAVSEGRLRLWLDSGALTETSLEALGDPGTRVAWLAGEVGGLRAGQLVVLGSPATALEARPGAVELRGPMASVLVARIEEEG